MCAIFGIHVKRRDKKHLSSLFVKHSLELMAHRGPDHSSVLDLSGHPLDFAGYLRYALRGKNQPALAGGSVLFFNGEIYNYRNLLEKQDHRGGMFSAQGLSEAESLLHFLEHNLQLGSFYEVQQQGFHALLKSPERISAHLKFIERIDGMFAISYINTRENFLLLLRDRWGTKPLYYVDSRDFFAYSSEIKPLLKVLENPEYDEIFLFQYLTFMDAYDDSTIFKGIKLLLPGHYLFYKPGGFPVVGKWHSGFVFKDSIKNEKEALQLLDEAFDEVFPDILESERPISSFLSGGIDSTLSSWYLNKHAGGRKSESSTLKGYYVLTYSSSDMEDLELSFEVPWAWKVASRSGVPLRVGLQTPEDAASSLDRLVWHLEEPRVGISLTNFYAFGDVKKMADVVLTGNGGDELFGGYSWRHGLAFEEDFDEKYFRAWEFLLFTDQVKPSFFTASFLNSVSGLSSREIFFRRFNSLKQSSNLKTALAFDIGTFLASLLLLDDKLSMAYPVEARHPFLTLPVLEVALNINDSLRVKIKEKGNPGASESILLFKYLLRKAVEKKFGPEVAWRRKTGFAPPLASWFRDLSFVRIYETRLLNTSSPIYRFFKRESVENVIRLHLQGVRDYSRRIWAFLYLDSLMRQVETDRFSQKASFVESFFC